MSTELTNLLPVERIKAFRKEYYIRLGALGALVATFVIGIHGVLLIPSYTYINQVTELERTRLAELTQNLASASEGEMQARLVRLKSDSERLVALGGAPKAARVIAALLEIPRTGITITGFTFRTANPEGRVTIAGVASTREALRQYHLALSSLTFAKSADLPLSAYAKEKDIPFVITLTGPLQP